MNNHIQQSMWFTVGVGVGAGLTWLLATREGRRTQRHIARRVKDGMECVNESGQAALEKGKEFINRGNEILEATGAAVGSMGRRFNLSSR